MRKVKIKDIKYLIEQAYVEVLLEQGEEDTPEDSPEDSAPTQEPAPAAAPETEMPDVTDTLLQKFPKLKGVLIRLMTRDFNDFVKTVEWVAPRPTTFKVTLQNDQDFTLKWTGKDFEATVAGKNYYLGTVDEFQQALDKLSILYQSAPLGNAEQGDLGGEPAPENAFNAGGGGGGDFPGGEASPEDAFGDEQGDETETPTADLGDEEVDFEAGAES